MVSDKVFFGMGRKLRRFRTRLGYYRARAKGTTRELGLFTLSMSYLAVYWITILQFPAFIRDNVIYSIATVLLTVEGFLVALSFNMQVRWIRNWVTVGLGVPAILVSVTTISRAYLESLQYNWLSYLPTTSLFIADNALFALFIELYAAGILLSGTREKEP